MPARPSPRNPVGVLAVTAGLLLPVLLASDYVTPLAYMALGFLHLIFLGGVDFPRYLKTLAVLSLVSVGLFALNVLFPAEGVNGLARGTAVFLRSVSLISLSVGFVFAVDPYGLVRAFMIDLHLEPRVGFALFAGWNTIPLLKRDLTVIDKAQALRFGRRKRSPRDRLYTATALLAGAVRHGERVALSMAARGMEAEASGPRTFLKDSHWTRRDTAYCLAGLLISGVAAWVIISMGFFMFDLG